LLAVDLEALAGSLSALPLHTLLSLEPHYLAGLDPEAPATGTTSGPDPTVTEQRQPGSAATTPTAAVAAAAPAIPAHAAAAAPAVVGCVPSGRLVACAPPAPAAQLAGATRGPLGGHPGGKPPHSSAALLPKAPGLQRGPTPVVATSDSSAGGGAANAGAVVDDELRLLLGLPVGTNDGPTAKVAVVTN
ncbi:hypothetical protein VOLCADRAFT_116624, partial [Volvox carteri f. nagariensis]